MSDFTATLDIQVPFTATELSGGVDFTPTGDFGQIIISNRTGFGEGGFGEGGFGGDILSVTINISETQWTEIETP